MSGGVIVLAWLMISPLAGAEAGQPGTRSGPSAATPAQAAEQRVRFYGFIRQDVIFDDSRPDAAQTPLFILSGGEHGEERANFTMHPRLTRVGVNLLGPGLEAIGGARIAGALEIDFQNGGRESRAIPRYRHAYMTLSWASASLLVGQTWDIISPLFPSVNADTLMWNAGNLGDRRPQIRASIQPKADRVQWSLAGGIGLTGAVDQQDLDGDGVRDGEAAAVPNIQGRVGLTYSLGARRLGLGVWAYGAREEVTTSIAGKTRFGSHALGVDVEVPLGGRAVVRGEAWTGSNLSDVRGGIGQAVNRTTGEAIDSSGGWVEIGGNLAPRYSVFVGYTIDSPTADRVPASGRTSNAAWFLVNQFSVRPFMVGLDYLHWRTEYRGLPEGTDNRVNAYVTFTF